MEIRYKPASDPVTDAILNGETSINLKDYYGVGSPFNLRYTNIMLNSALRQHVMYNAKEPLEKAIIGAGEGKIFRLIQGLKYVDQYPEPTPKNCEYINTLKLFEIRDEFIKKNSWWLWIKPLRKATERLFKLLIAEYEHDLHYSYRYDVILEYVLPEWKYGKLANNYKTLKFSFVEFMLHEECKRDMMQSAFDILLKSYRLLPVRYGINSVISACLKSGWEFGNQERIIPFWRVTYE